MSVTSGFFNSLNHDRRYNAQQMSAIFDGIINDGVFANIGVAFKVNADTGVTINIGEGKAWFTSAWVYNDALLPMTLEGSEVVLDRIDAVVIDVDHNDSVRLGSIKVVKGTPSSSPKRPAMISDRKHSQHPLAYIYRKAGSTEITQADITNMVGTSSCPYITGILQVQNIDNIVAQWNAQWNKWYAEKVAETDSDASELMAEMKSEFDIWFNDIQALLDDDVATALAAQVAEIQGKFDDLAREGTVYDTIEDVDFDPILGSDGTPLQGKTVFGGVGINVSKPSDIGAVAVDGTTPMKGPLDMNMHRVQNVSNPEVDTDAATAGYAKMVASQASSPRNLLDNSDFTNPVNQRGAATYNKNQEYTIDRWIYRGANNSSLKVEDGYITLTKNNSTYTAFKQALNHDECNVKGKTVTAAIKIKSCTGECELRLVTGISASSDSNAFTRTSFTEPGIILLTGVFPDDSTTPYIGVSIAIVSDTGSYSIEWAALYEGEYTADNLPVYQPKGYGAELAECQRYYQYYKELEAIGYLTGYAKSYFMNIWLPVPMRVQPSIASSPTWLGRLATGGYSKASSSTAIGFTSLNVWGSVTDAGIQMLSLYDAFNESPGDTNNSVLHYRINNLALSADL